MSSSYSPFSYRNSSKQPRSCTHRMICRVFRPNCKLCKSNSRQRLSKSTSLKRSWRAAFSDSMQQHPSSKGKK